MILQAGATFREGKQRAALGGDERGNAKGWIAVLTVDEDIDEREG
jgi:hypothetical protein